MKRCSKCGLEKEESKFYKDKNKNYSLRSQCKICELKLNKEYKSKNKNRIKEVRKNYILNHKDSLIKTRKKYYLKNKDKLIKKAKDFYTLLWKCPQNVDICKA